MRIAGRTYKLDYAWEHSLHAIEYQGDPHEAVSAIHDDATRMFHLHSAGWTLWYVTRATPDAHVIEIGHIATR